MTGEAIIKIESLIDAETFQRQCVHILDLCGLRAATGPLWNAIQDGVRTKFEALLRKKLAATDSYEQLSDTRYLIVTPSAEGDDGAIFCLRAIYELAMSLNGRCELDQLRIESATYEGPLKIRSRTLRPDTLVALADKCQMKDLAVPAHLRRGQSAVESRPIRQEVSNRAAEYRVTHQFEPVWDARHQAISTYLCVPQLLSSSSSANPAPALSTLSIRERTNIELSCLTTGIGYLSRFIEAGDRFLLGVPISFDTLCSPYGRMEFTGLCRGLPSTYRQYLIFLVTDVPVGVTHSRLSDLGTILRPFGRVIACVASGCRNMAAYDGQGFSGIAYDFAKAGDDAERIRGDVVYVGAAGRNMHFGAMIMNLDDAHIVNIANAADFRLLHGNNIAPPLPEPKRMTRLGADRVMGTTAKAGTEEWF